MFDYIHPSNDPQITNFDPDSIPDADPGLAGSHPDAGALLAAVGMPAHAVREFIGSRSCTGATAE